jgi:hypothetical protein
MCSFRALAMWDGTAARRFRFQGAKKMFRHVAWSEAAEWSFRGCEAHVTWMWMMISVLSCASLLAINIERAKAPEHVGFQPNPQVIRIRNQVALRKRLYIDCAAGTESSHAVAVLQDQA